jgi:hypothetical protein
MDHIAPRTAPRFLGSEFNPFLFASVGTDHSGGQLSVVSALARLDLDAWAEAAALARLPRDIATAKLSALLRRFTEIPQVVQDSGSISARLIALLPNGTAPRLPAIVKPEKWAAGPAAAGLGILLVAALLLGMQFFSMTQAGPGAHAGTTSQAADMARPAIPPP